MDAIQKDPNFNFPMNLTGVQAASGGGRDLPTGFYKVKINDAYSRQSQTGRSMVEFKAEVVEDAMFNGIIRTFRIMVPKDETDGVKHFWRSALESLGYSTTEIDGAGVIGISRTLLINRVGHLQYVAGNKDAGVYDKADLIVPADWATNKQAAAAADAAIAAATGAPAPAAIGGGLSGGLSTQQAAPSGLSGGGLGGSNGIATPAAGAVSSQGLMAKLGAPA